MELRAPAPSFNRVKEIEKGFRALGAPGSVSAQRQYVYSRINIALGLPGQIDDRFPDFLKTKPPASAVHKILRILPALRASVR